jgi:hypothetical protein
VESQFVIPAWADFFGPLPGEGYSEILPQRWVFLTAVTANTRLFRFDLGMPPLAWALWRVVWTTRTPYNATRLIHFDDGVVNIGEIGGYIRPDSARLGSPANQGVDVTNELNALIAGRVAKNIGVQIWGDAQQPVTMYASRLELCYKHG